MAPDQPTSLTSPMQPDLDFHGDRELADGLVDLAVNVRPGTPPPWLREVIRAATDDIAAYPDPAAATEAVARRHGRPSSEVLVTAGAAEAFTLIARAFRPRRAVVVHPQFTEPEAALRAAGHRVERAILPPPFQLGPGAIPAEADLVIVGNPTNPTSVLHPADTIRALARPGRTLVVDEAFADCVPGEPESLAAARDVPGLIVVRSLTKTWGLAGLRAGYLLATPADVQILARPRPPWAVSSPALAAVIACCGQGATAEAAAWAAGLATEREHLIRRLSELPGATVTPGARASFILIKIGSPLPAATRAVEAASGPAQPAGVTAASGSTGPAVRPNRPRAPAPGRFRGPPGRHVPGPGPRLAPHRGPRPCHQRPVRGRPGPRPRCHQQGDP